MTTLLSNGFLKEIGSALVFGLGYYAFGKLSQLYSKDSKKLKEKVESTNKQIDEIDACKSMNAEWQRKTSFASCESGEVDFIVDEQVEKQETKVKNKSESALEQNSYTKTLEVYKKQVELEYSDLDFDNNPFNVLMSLKSKGVEPTIDVYNCLLFNSYEKYGNDNNENADELLNEIFDSTNSIEPNLYTLNIIIKGLGLKYKNDPVQFDTKLVKFFEIFENKQIIINLSTHNVILECLVNMHRAEDAWTQFTNMQKLYEPEHQTICLIVKNILHELQSDNTCIWLKRALEIYNKFYNDFNDAFSLDFIKDVVSHSIQDKFFINNGMSIFESNLKSKNFDDKFLNEMLDFYILRLNIEVVENIYNKLTLKSNEIKIKMLKFCTVCRMCDYGMEIYESIENKDDEVQQMMIRLNMYENKFSYILNTFFKNDLYKQCGTGSLNFILNCAIEIYDEKRFNILAKELENKEKNNYSYHLLMKGYYTFNMKDELVKELNECLSKGFKIDRYTYNQIIDILLREKDTQQLKDFSTKMNDYELSTDNQLKILSIYIEENNATKAYEIFNELYLKNNNKVILLNDKIINDIIKLQIDNNYVDRSITLFNSILKNNYMPHFQMFDAIINKCIENDCIKDACDITILALEKKISLDANILNNLPSAIKTCGKDQFKSYEKVQVAQRIYSLIDTEDSEYMYNNTLKNGFYNIFTDSHKCYKNKQANTSNEKNRKHKKPSTPITNYNSEDEVSLYDSMNSAANQSKQLFCYTQREASIYKNNEDNNEDSIYTPRVNNKNTKKGKRRTNKKYNQPQEEVSIYA